MRTLIAAMLFVVSFTATASAQITVELRNTDFNDWVFSQARVTVEVNEDGRWRELYKSSPCTVEEVQLGRDGCVSSNGQMYLSAEKMGFNTNQTRVMVNMPGYDKGRGDVEYGFTSVYMNRQLLGSYAWTYVDNGYLMSGYYVFNNHDFNVRVHYKSTFTTEGLNIEKVDSIGVQGVTTVRAGSYLFWYEKRQIQPWMYSLPEGAKICSSIVVDAPEINAYAFGSGDGCFQGSLGWNYYARPMTSSTPGATLLYRLPGITHNQQPVNRR